MVVMTLVVNEYEIWVVPRFSRVLIVPLGAILSKSPLGPAVLAGRGFAASLALCLATNLMYGYYLTRFFAR
jgi:hypothetical protein